MNSRQNDSGKAAILPETTEQHVKSGENPVQKQPAESGSVKNGVLKRFVWPLLKVPLYVVFLAATVILILAGLEKMAGYALSKTTLAHVYPNDPSMALRDFTKPVSHYDYDFNPGVCLEYNLLKGNRYEYANNAGFRDPRDISTDKPEDEYRIFLVGGSTAYGLGAVGEAAPAMNYYGIPFRETIAHQLELILNANAPIPGKTIRVYNTAVWGYAYQHHLMRYVTKLRLYRPDLVISLDGANEIPPMCKLTKDWDYFQEGQFNNIIRHIFAYNGSGLTSYLTLWLKNNTFLMTYVWGGRDLFQELHQGEPQELHRDPAEESETSDASSSERPDQSRALEEKSRFADRNAATVVRVVEDFHGALRNDGIPHLFALQPWFYLSKKQMTEQERTLASLTGTRTYYGVPSDKMYQLFINKVSESARTKGYFLVDFSAYFDDVTEWVFTDWCHLTAGANYLLAKELANLVKEHIFGQALTKGDLIDNKNSFFWDFAPSAKVLYAPPSDKPENGPRNMLSGYPGQAVYSSVVPSGVEKAEVVLDVGHVYPVSRVRLVWADEESVPEKWAVEVSTDRNTWKTLVEATREHTDNYSQWPGFEHVASEPSEARYVRYRPLDGKTRPIKLRCWNIQR
ncbi:MAG: discoidin domain-containing protein [Desulfomonilaceae bacterium]|nr:discoidin domain-containing protein [Desulfomonilaceae bacterium]